MQCERCGAAIPEESSYCGQCGAPKPAQAKKRSKKQVAQAVQESAPQPAVHESSGQAEQTPGKSSGRTCLWIGVGCAVLLLIGFCVVLAIAFPLVRTLIEDINLAKIEAFATTVVEVVELGEPEQDSTEPPVMEEPTRAPEPDVCFNVLCFSYPEGEDYGVLPSVLPAELEPEWWAFPEHDDFALSDYPLSDTFHEAHVAVYPVAEFLEINPMAEEGLAELEDFLASKPVKPERVPFVLPIFNAGQFLTVQVEYLEFDGGHGVRFVSQYGQAAWPINNKDIFYAFQGLTDDGSYIISAVLPVTHPSLPADGETFIGDEYDAFIDTFEDYLFDIERQLDMEDPESFFPDLTALDEMMETMRVEIP